MRGRFSAIGCDASVRIGLVVKTLITCLLTSTISNATARLVQSESRFETVKKNGTPGRVGTTGESDLRGAPIHRRVAVRPFLESTALELFPWSRGTRSLQAVLLERTVAEAADEHTLPIEPLHATATADFSARMRVG